MSDSVVPKSRLTFSKIIHELQKGFKNHTPRNRKHKAFLVGIDYTKHYKEPGGLSLPCKDILRFRDELIGIHGFHEEDIIVLVDKNQPNTANLPNHANIMRHLETFIGKDETEDVTYLFVYSGHSGQREEEGPIRTERDGQEEFIVPCDAFVHQTEGTDSWGVREKFLISDKTLNEHLVKPMERLRRSQLIAFFDSCHSGTLLNLPHDRCNNVEGPMATARRFHRWTIIEPTKRGRSFFRRIDALRREKSLKKAGRRHQEDERHTVSEGHSPSGFARSQPEDILSNTASISRNSRSSLRSQYFDAQCDDLGDEPDGDADRSLDIDAEQLSMSTHYGDHDKDQDAELAPVLADPASSLVSPPITPSKPHHAPDQSYHTSDSSHAFTDYSFNPSLFGPNHSQFPTSSTQYLQVPESQRSPQRNDRNPTDSPYVYGGAESGSPKSLGSPTPSHASSKYTLSHRRGQSEPIGAPSLNGHPYTSDARGSPVPLSPSFSQSAGHGSRRSRSGSQNSHRSRHSRSRTEGDARASPTYDYERPSSRASHHLLFPLIGTFFTAPAVAGVQANLAEIILDDSNSSLNVEFDEIEFRFGAGDDEDTDCDIDSVSSGWGVIQKYRSGLPPFDTGDVDPGAQTASEHGHSQYTTERATAGTPFSERQDYEDKDAESTYSLNLTNDRSGTPAASPDPSPRAGSGFRDTVSSLIHSATSKSLIALSTGLHFRLKQPKTKATQCDGSWTCARSNFVRRQFGGRKNRPRIVCISACKDSQRMFESDTSMLQCVMDKLRHKKNPTLKSLMRTIHRHSDTMRKGILPSAEKEHLKTLKEKNPNIADWRFRFRGKFCPNNDTNKQHIEEWKRDIEDIRSFRPQMSSLKPLNMNVRFGF